MRYYRGVLAGLMAVAITTHLTNYSYDSAAKQYYVNCIVEFIGDDVPGHIIDENLSVAVSSNATIAQIQSAVATTIRNSSSGLFTIPAGAAAEPSYTGL
jgi:hypothetical protein